MAEVIGIIGSSIAIANSAATLSRALFDVVETIKNARKEIANIAQQLSLLSGSLHVLADVIDSHRHLYKPALYGNTKLIIAQYGNVDRELRKFLETPRTLARLTWCIQRTKVKSLLREIEAIKTLLTLELNVVQLAKEESLRPLLNSNAKDTSTHSPNRFRRLVESTVQANRQVIESAQREDAEETEEKTHKSDEVRAEMDIYREGLFDTATWLYHLVFSPQVLDPPVYIPTDQGRPYQASVSDEGAEGAVRLMRTPPISTPTPTTLDGPSHTNKAMIIWSRQTEPSHVVDRLLSSWTTLTDEQIVLSATHQKDDGWRDSFLKKVGEVKEEQYDNAIETTDSDDSESSAYESNPDYVVSTAHRKNMPFDQHHGSDLDSRPRRTPNARQDKAEKRVHTMQRRKDKRRQQSNDPWASVKPNPSRDMHPVPMRREHSSGPKRHVGASRAASRSTSQTHSTPHYPFSNSFRPPQSFGLDTVDEGWPGVSAELPPSYPPGPQWPHSKSSFGSSPTPMMSPGMFEDHHSSTNTTPPTVAPPPFPRPNKSQESVPALKTDQKEEAFLAAIARLISKEGKSQPPDADGTQLDRIMGLLIKQQEQHAQSELDRARAITELEMKSMLAARDKDDASIRRLEKLLLEERDKRQKSEAVWRAERLAQDEHAAKQAQEARELVEREISAARDVEKAARKSLKFAKAEAEKKAKAETEEKARKEREMDAHKLNEVIQRYERQFDAMTAKQSQAQLNDGIPVRRTIMANGIRSIEVAEYGADTTIPFDTPSPGAAAWFQEELFMPRNPERDDRSHSGLSQHRHERLHRTTTAQPSLGSPTISSRSVGASNQDQQMIVFPSKVDQRSAKISELQSSLAKVGVNATFQDAELDAFDEMSIVKSSLDVVRSSIFWDSPSRGSDSELLATYRRSGWRPSYARSSDAGHTYFLGSQPVHAYFFRPDYTPQFLPSEVSSRSGSIIIDKGLIHEYALQESGLTFDSTEAGAYILDGRLQYSDIEALIERSFSMKEVHFRRAYRQLQWQCSDSSPSTEVISAGQREPHSKCTPPGSPTSMVESHTSGAETESCFEEQEEEESDIQQVDSKGEKFAIERFRKSDSDDEDLPSLHKDSTSNATPSMASWSSKSSNPFRKLMEEAAAKAELERTLKGFQENIWDDPILR